jgi:hypothetical protein
LRKNAAAVLSCCVMPLELMMSIIHVASWPSTHEVPRPAGIT